jgi:tRNA pseudouridine13 synthase
LLLPDLDRLLGMEAYATTTEGIGGKIKEATEDFVVEEVLVDGSKASVQGEVATKVLGSTQTPQRFLLCVLVKRNWDTFIAVKNLAKTLGIDQNRIQFAGIKDAKALTAQHITIENAAAEDLAKAEVKDISVHPVGYVREQMSLFYLLGNNFTITIKNIDSPHEAIREQIAQTNKQLNTVGGIPNFFGHQRFGTTRPITHLVGKALVQGNFEEAAMLFLAKPSPIEHPASRQARQQLQDTGDFKTASMNFPRQLRFERQMLSHLAEHQDDFVGAFQRLPPKLQALFVQAHQSFLFNLFLSGRVLAGLPLNEAVAGDFVVGVERSGLPMTAVAKEVTEQNLSEINLQVNAGKLRIALPIVGVKQKLSGGVMGEIEAQVLEQEGVDLTKLRINELSMLGGKGGLRTAVTPIKDFALREASEEKAVVSFMLLRGSYATVALREIMKPQNPVTSGF